MEDKSLLSLLTPCQKPQGTRGQLEVILAKIQIRRGQRKVRGTEGRSIVHSALLLHEIVWMDGCSTLFAREGEMERRLLSNLLLLTTLSHSSGGSPYRSGYRNWYKAIAIGLDSYRNGDGFLHNSLSFQCDFSRQHSL